VLLTMTLVSGPVWARTSWGRIWTPDPKLVSTAAMWLTYAAYLMLRQGIAGRERRARAAALIGILSIFTVLMAYSGTRLIAAAIHPTVIGPSAANAASGFGITPRMAHTLAASTVSFTLLLGTLVWHRVRLERLAEQVEALWLTGPREPIP
jgi:heme exporter protein C